MATTLETLLDQLEARMAEVEQFDEPARQAVLALLDGVDALHRQALAGLGDALGPAGCDHLRASSPALRWLLDAYGVGVDERGAAEAAIQSVRPFVESHGGTVELLEARQGQVKVRLAGACSGCTASSSTLTHGVEEALRRHLPGFVALEAEMDESAPAHPPPAETFVELGRRAG